MIDAVDKEGFLTWQHELTGAGQGRVGQGELLEGHGLHVI